jgi:hypothetical protein
MVQFIARRLKQLIDSDCHWLSIKIWQQVLNSKPVRQFRRQDAA